jgi:hypothetical protein
MTRLSFYCPRKYKDRFRDKLEVDLCGMEDGRGVAVTSGVRVSGKEEESVCASMEFPEEAYGCDQV